MLRSSRFTPLYAIALAVVLAAAFATPAFAHRGGRDHGGKKAVGEVLSYDGTTLTVSMTDGTTVAAPVAADVKIKVEHRGQKAHGKGHKKPSNGSLEDLKAGAKVLKMKLTCGEVDKLRLRRAPAPAEPDITPAGDPLGDGEVEGPGTADEVQLPDTTETEEDDGCGADEDDAAEDDADEDEADGDDAAGDDAAEDEADGDDAADEAETELGDGADDGSADDGSDDLLEDVTEVVEAPTV